MTGLKIEQVPIDSLTRHPTNPRVGDVEALVKSLEAFGQRAPIVYRDQPLTKRGRKKYRVIIIGNHRWLAAQQLGWSKVAATSANDLTWEQAEALMLADNRTGDLATNDEDLLRQMLTVMEPELAAAASYDDMFIKAMLERDVLEDWASDLEEGEANRTKRVQPGDVFAAFSLTLRPTDRDTLIAGIKEIQTMRPGHYDTMAAVVLAAVAKMRSEVLDGIG